MCNISTMYVQRGIEKGKLELLCDLVKQKILSIEQAAAQLNLSVMEFKKIAKLS